MHWPVEDFWRWWSSQPEICEAELRLEAELRHRRWALQKTQNKIAREEERLQRRGFSQRQIAMFKRISGVQPDDLQRELAGGT